MKCYQRRFVQIDKITEYDSLVEANKTKTNKKKLQKIIFFVYYIYIFVFFSKLSLDILLSFYALCSKESRTILILKKTHSNSEN